ncbi:MAG: hypothetical protein K0Q47_1660 [Sedimentibacter sp.]|nr:hypothetical protein [Sedimentibacter sp.]
MSSRQGGNNSREDRGDRNDRMGNKRRTYRL